SGVDAGRQRKGSFHDGIGRSCGVDKVGVGERQGGFMKFIDVLAMFLTPFLLFQAGSVSFEVASIKAHAGDVTFSAEPALRGTQVTANSSTLLDMITVAYGVRYDQILGGPGWMTREHFDLAAKVPGTTPPSSDEFHAMMQRLLTERFQLKIHRE